MLIKDGTVVDDATTGLTIIFKEPQDKDSLRTISVLLPEGSEFEGQWRDFYFTPEGEFDGTGFQPQEPMQIEPSDEWLDDFGKDE